MRNRDPEGQALAAVNSDQKSQTSMPRLGAVVVTSSTLRFAELPDEMLWVGCK